MLAKADDVGIFVRALNESELEIYFSIYMHEYMDLTSVYQSIAKYYKDIDTIVIQFMNTTNFSCNGYT